MGQEAEGDLVEELGQGLISGSALVERAFDPVLKASGEQSEMTFDIHREGGLILIDRKAGVGHVEQLMIDVKFLRENPEMVQQAVSRKKFEVNVPAVLALDEARRSAIQEAEQTRALQKAANQEMASLDKKSPEFQEKIKAMKALSAEAKSLEAKAKELDQAFKEGMMSIPNLPDPEIPDGTTEADNRLVQSWGNIEAYPNAIAHWDIPWIDTLIDMKRGVKVTGAGFPFILGGMARLARSLVWFLMNEAESAGYQLVIPPLLVNEDSALATGQLPDKEGQMYWDEQDNLYLIPTAEVPVTNFLRDEVIDKERLPIYCSAYTPCFRREAGSWGADVRGLNRLHQFDKVELVKWTAKEESAAELESLRAYVEGILEKLELPYRTLLMCAGDIGFPHHRQYDMEVWAAGQQKWLEVSSCSNFTDFQARRANIRYRDSDGKLYFVHTLNGSGLGLARTLAAILENNWDPDTETVFVPEVLRPLYNDDSIGLKDIG